MDKTTNFLQSGYLSALACALVIAATPAIGAEPSSADVQDTQRSASKARAADGEARVDADPIRVRFERMPAPELKQVYTACSERAIGSRLGSSHIAICSTAYDVLLRRDFGGDFGAFFAWSQSVGKAQNRDAMNGRFIPSDGAAPPSSHALEGL